MAVGAAVDITRGACTVWPCGRAKPRDRAAGDSRRAPIGFFERRSRSLRPTDIVTAGRFAYVASYADGLSVLDLASAEKPREVGFLDMDVWGRKVFDRGATAGLVSRSGVHVVDVRDKTAPRLVGELLFPDVWDAVFDGAHAFVVPMPDGTPSLEIVDFSDPANPVLVSSLAIHTPPKGLTVAGELVFMAFGGRLIIANVADASHPVVVHDQPFAAYDVAVRGRIAFVAAGTQGLTTWDISNPASPQRIGGLQAPGFTAGGVRLDGNRAYVNGYYGGLFVVDVSDPAEPRLISSSPLGGRGVAASGHFLYVPLNDAGLAVVRACVDTGDTNCDGSLNTFDIQPFLSAVISPETYRATYPGCDIGHADANGDGSVNQFDIAEFARLLGV